MQNVSSVPNTFYRVSLKAVIRNEKNEVLVCKEGSSDTWSLPGGGWDHGETEYEALARELKEEVNYDGKFNARPFATSIFWLESKQAWLLWIVYDVTTESMDFSSAQDTTEVAFIDPATLSEPKSQAEQWINDNLS